MNQIRTKWKTIWECQLGLVVASAHPYQSRSARRHRRLPPSVLPRHLSPAGMVTREPLSIRALSFVAVGAPRSDAQVFCFGDKVLCDSAFWAHCAFWRGFNYSSNQRELVSWGK